MRVMLKIKAKPQYNGWPVRVGTDEEVVDAFLDIHKSWWADQTNTLYGQREASRKALLDFIRRDKWPGPVDLRGLHYVVAKCNSDYLCDYEPVKRGKKKLTRTLAAHPSRPRRGR